MSEQIAIELQDGILCATIVGPYHLHRAQAWIQQVAEGAAAHNCQRVLMDLRKVEGAVSVLDRFRLGEYAADAFKQKVLLALWVSPDEVDLDRFMETVASTRGLSTQIFTDGAEARSWLQGTVTYAKPET